MQNNPDHKPSEASQTTPRDGSVYVKLRQISEGEFRWSVEYWNEGDGNYHREPVDNRLQGESIGHGYAVARSMRLYRLHIAGEPELLFDPTEA